MVQRPEIVEWIKEIPIVRDQDKRKSAHQTTPREPYGFD